MSGCGIGWRFPRADGADGSSGMFCQSDDAEAMGIKSARCSVRQRRFPGQEQSTVECIPSSTQGGTNVTQDRKTAASATVTIHDQRLHRGVGGELHQIAEDGAEVLTTSQGAPWRTIRTR